jgi:tRNA dimethylallyltransferase
VVGPTAVGKTAFAIQLALELQTEILSADSRQCYREMNIGVARPSAAELQMVRHHFIASHSILDEVNAAVYEQYALHCLEEIFKNAQTAVVVGGTGLYIKALCEGLDPVPPSDPDLRKEIIASYLDRGLGWLQQQVEQLDPVYFASGEMQNPQRLMRALEVVRLTGKSIRTYHSSKPQQRPFKIHKIGLDLPREELYARINQRVDLMMQAGQLEEAETLFNTFGLAHLPPSQWPPALRTVGYVELFDYFRGICSYDKAIDLIRQHTRNYAKRQLTWFRRDPAVHWRSPAGWHPAGED